MWYSAYCENRDRNLQPRDRFPFIFSHHLTSLLAIEGLGGGTLKTLIQSSRLFQCSDPRDRIYGIVGLIKFDNVPGVDYGIPDGWMTPEVDYNKTPVQLYFDIMKWCLINGIQGGTMSIRNVQKTPERTADEISVLTQYNTFDLSGADKTYDLTQHNRPDLLDLSRILQEALKYPFESQNDLPLGYACGNLEQKFQVRLYCGVYVHQTSSIFKVYLSAHKDCIRWTTKDDVDPENSDSDVFGGTFAISKMDLNKVLQVFEPIDRDAKDSGVTFQSASEPGVAGYLRTLKDSGCVHVMEMHSFSRSSRRFLREKHFTLEHSKIQG